MNDDNASAAAQEIEIPPEVADNVILTELKLPRLSRPIKNDTEEVSLERFRSGYRLVRIVLYVIAGVFLVGITHSMIMTWLSQPSVMDIKEFSLEVIRLLIPPLTFVLGFLFGAKEKE